MHDESAFWIGDEASSGYSSHGVGEDGSSVLRRRMRELSGVYGYCGAPWAFGTFWRLNVLVGVYGVGYERFEMGFGRDRSSSAGVSHLGSRVGSSALDERDHGWSFGLLLKGSEKPSDRGLDSSSLSSGGVHGRVGAAPIGESMGLPRFPSCRRWAARAALQKVSDDSRAEEATRWTRQCETTVWAFEGVCDTRVSGRCEARRRP